MRVKTDINAPNWTGEDHPGASKRWYEWSPARLLSPGSRGAVKTVKLSARARGRTSVSLVEVRDQLRNEIRHGKEYLLQVRSELRENRQLLEHWAQYEVTCSLRPLDQLVRSVWLKERVEQFLVGWLARREKKLGAVSGKIAAAFGNGKKHRRS